MLERKFEAVVEVAQLRHMRLSSLELRYVHLSRRCTGIPAACVGARTVAAGLRAQVSMTPMASSLVNAHETPGVIISTTCRTFVAIRKP